jgi:hypothetical protein
MVNTVNDHRQKWGKAEVVRHLAEVFNYRSYLEISTTTTGFRFGDARTVGFESCIRCMYRCEDTYSDGQPIHFRSGDLDIRACLEEMTARGLAFDVIFIDSHHTYECSMRDIREAFARLPEGGALVIHDCDPPNELFARPAYWPGPWCGVSYKAYIDFVLGNEALEYCTVDTDFGCGVIVKRSPGSVRPRVLAFSDAPLGDGFPQLVAAWGTVGQNFSAAFNLFAANRRALLRMVSVDQFRKGLCGTSQPHLRSGLPASAEPPHPAESERVSASATPR